MKIQKWIPFAVVALLAMTGVNVQADQMNSKTTQTQADCSAMSADEQQFATKLTDANRSLFCGAFNEMQRLTVMEIAGQTDTTGNMMTEDQAVVKVATDDNMLPAQTMQKNASGCPVK